jgi:ParB family chromosome partitioning protein
MHKQYFEVEIDQVIIRKRPRRNLGDLSDLVSSIRKLGILHPILVDADNVLLSGARRLEACRQAGLRTAPALRMDTKADPLLALTIQADENLCRKPLSPEELENHIRMKKAAIGGGRSGFLGALVSGLKRLFGRG